MRASGRSQDGGPRLPPGQPAKGRPHARLARYPGNSRDRPAVEQRHAGCHCGGEPMTHLRLFIYEGSEVLDRTYSRFPVRIGRHPRNECQLVDSHISRFHAQIECESGALVVRDVGSENGTLIMEGASGRMLRGTGARSSDGQLALLLGHGRVLARIEEGEREELPDAFAPAAREAAQALLDACAPYATRVYAGAAGPETLHPVIDALFRNLLRLDSALQGDDLNH